ncbi:MULTISPECIES: ABC transporter ATP-binding protein [unclassified Methylobacterium]|jgi:iron complex transport system ATP-binding protein|uniref:ABC transporter ATP-binding protein n=1 Tax=unclassified Methylobacterium TaxID=2615210 RepID=UPI001353B047|nr:ABC transporter ATP-binding protein [Methylobacterium sp. 2A]MWV25642.1 ABC transporter ATP-binding protein [Methylobacterium sp. 2A]
MLLRVADLAFGYGDRIVGSGVSFDLAAGEVLCLLGPNGGGKTTLLKTLLGLLPARAGLVQLDGSHLSRLSRTAIARTMAAVPQAHAAFFPFTVRDMVVMGRASRLGPFAAPGPSDIAAAERALATLGIGHLAGAVYTEISGGERQLALIARALSGEPRLLVMDEPTASLDFGNQARVLGQIRRLAQGGIAVLFSTHDPGHALLCADRVIALHAGRLAADGPSAETVTPPLLRLIYGIDVVMAPVPGIAAPVCAPVIR